MFVEQLTQALAPQDIVFSQTITNTTVNTNGVNMTVFKRAYYLVSLTNVGAAGVLAITPQSSKYWNFNSGVHNMSGFSITNMTTNNTVVTVEVRGDQITQQNADNYFRLALTGSGNPITIGTCYGIGGEAIQKPGGVGNLTSNINTTTVTQQSICST